MVSGKAEVARVVFSLAAASRQCGFCGFDACVNHVVTRPIGLLFYETDTSSMTYP
jgi:hypothetical protein